MKILSKRLFLILPLLMLALALAGFTAPQEPAFTLAVASDLHYIAPELTDGGAYFTRITENADGKAMRFCEEITDAFVRRILAQKPDALILSGDLTFNGARQSHEACAQKLRQIEEGGVPVLVIPGNHDLNNRMAACFRGDGYALVESADASAFASIYADFGYREALSRDEASLSYLCALRPRLWALMLDVNTAEAPGSLKEETLHWAQAQLEMARENGARMIAVSHQNLLVHNSLFSYGFVIAGAEPLRGLYEENGVLCNLSGHLHIQHIAQSDAGFPEILVSSLVTAPFQYGLLSVEADSLRFHTEKLSFDNEEAAARFFWESSYRKALQDEADTRMAAFLADVNAAYFAGRTDTLRWDDELCDKWLESSVVTGIYLQGIRDEGFRDQTAAQFSY